MIDIRSSLLASLVTVPLPGDEEFLVPETAYDLQLKQVVSDFLDGSYKSKTERVHSASVLVAEAFASDPALLIDFSSTIPKTERAEVSVVSIGVNLQYSACVKVGAPLAKSTAVVLVDSELNTNCVIDTEYSSNKHYNGNIIVDGVEQVRKSGLSYISQVSNCAKIRNSVNDDLLIQFLRSTPPELHPNVLNHLTCREKFHLSRKIRIPIRGCRRDNLRVTRVENINLLQLPPARESCICQSMLYQSPWLLDDNPNIRYLLKHVAFDSPWITLSPRNCVSIRVD